MYSHLNWIMEFFSVFLGLAKFTFNFYCSLWMSISHLSYWAATRSRKRFGQSSGGKRFLFKCSLLNLRLHIFALVQYVFLTPQWGSMCRETISQTVSHSHSAALNRKCDIMFLCRTFNKAAKLKWHFHREVFSFLSQWIKVNPLDLCPCWTSTCICDSRAEMKLGL